ncbi:amino acid aminotransferase [Agaribacterium haliotis]|uniref:amino acid aminotransferase n=1 Tax=Agaribacterium haliotis TaxID=2013869 RepID=UPI000BB5347F|nr:amino acid aminotransferase [Agaribacterium haliotis]
MFEQLTTLSPDPLLGLIKRFAQDPRPEKIDLGVGVYRDDSGQTPVLAAVKAAESQLLQSESSKSYVGPAGNLEFCSAMAELLFGRDLSAKLQARVASLQTPGGCGALRVLGETIVRANQKARLWASDPTWANHLPLLGSAGLQINNYRYYDFAGHGLDFDGMMSDLQQAQAGDVLLLHACCHNPSGADLNQQQWQQVIELCQQQNLVPLIDVAYLGFGDGLDEDAYGLRLAVERLPEVLIAVSCSKNFGLYRERVGAAFVISENAASAQACFSHMASITRAMYSMPPSHGASVVAAILDDETLAQQWLSELTQMRERIQSLRSQLRQSLADELGHDRFAFIEAEKGMFSFLGLDADQVQRLAEDFGIYMADSSRINLAGLNSGNLAHLVSSLKLML